MADVLDPYVKNVSTDKPITVQVSAIDENKLIQVITLDEYGEVSAETEGQKVIPMSSDIIIHKGYSPFILEDTGTWFEYDNKIKAFVDTGIIAGVNEAVKNQINNNTDKIENISKLVPNILTNSELEDMLV